MKIYLDVCCLNRPFDDHTQDKIRLESEAIITILSHISEKKWEMIGSDIIDFEISQIPDPDRMKKVLQLVNLKAEKVTLTDNVVNRSKKIQEYTIKLLDALHLACAEEGKAEVFLTTDQYLIKKSTKNLEKIKVKVKNPLNWIMEVI